MFKFLWNRRKSGNAMTCTTWNDEADIKLLLESEHFLNIFPELVWKHIIKQLDFNDLQNLSNSSSFFRNLLLHKRIQFLFKDVFEVVAPRLLGNINKNGSMARERWSQQKQVQALIFNCRLACRAWNKSICILAKDINPHWNWDTGNRDKYALFQFITEAYEFTTVDEIDVFHRKFQGYSESPIFGETIFLSVPKIQVVEGNLAGNAFYDNVADLLYVYGKYVTNCQIHLTSILSVSTHDLQDTYCNLIDILWALPNLKHLSIVNYDSISADQIANMRTPPTLKKLVSLSMHSVSGLVCNELVRHNLQISTLVIDQSRHNLQDAFAYYLVHPLENLEHLEIIWCSWNEISYLKDFDFTFPKLKLLKLKYYSVADDTSPDWLEVFYILTTKLGKNLEYLELCFPEITKEESKSKVVNDMLEFRLELPKVKKMNLTVKNDVTFDFLLGMSSSLEFLCITSLAARQRGIPSENYLKAKCNETVELLSCYDKLYRSNIWELFPKLKSVELCDGFNFSWSYNRNDWQKKETRTPKLFKRWFSTD